MKKIIVFVFLFPFLGLGQNQKPMEGSNVNELDEVYLYSSFQTKEMGFHKLCKTAFPALWKSGGFSAFQGVYIKNKAVGEKLFISGLIVDGLKIEEERQVKIQVSLYAFDPVSKKLGEVLFGKTLTFLGKGKKIEVEIEQLIEFPEEGVMFALKAHEGKFSMRLGKTKNKVPYYIINTYGGNTIQYFYSDIFKPQKNSKDGGFLPLMGVKLRQY